MNKQNLSKKIAKKLEQLAKLLDKTDEARIIESDDPETWDSDTLYDLIENCKMILWLLADQKSNQLDEYGEPIVLESGLCSLIEEYNSEEEEDDD